jgi:hypothetical protein
MSRMQLRTQPCQDSRHNRNTHACRDRGLVVVLLAAVLHWQYCSVSCWCIMGRLAYACVAIAGCDRNLNKAARAAARADVGRLVW